MKLARSRQAPVSRPLCLAAALLFVVSAPGCGLIFGGSQKVDNKSSTYAVHRLDREPAKAWRSIHPGAAPDAGARGASSSEQEPDQADVAFEHRSTGAVASVNSVCRPLRGATLADLAKNLFMGLPDAITVSSRETELDGVPALDSVVEWGDVRVRALVLHKSGCTYDLMYIARKSAYDQSQADFERFLRGFHAE